MTTLAQHKLFFKGYDVGLIRGREQAQTRINELTAQLESYENELVQQRQQFVKTLREMFLVGRNPEVAGLLKHYD